MLKVRKNPFELGVRTNIEAGELRTHVLAVRAAELREARGRQDELHEPADLFPPAERSVVTHRGAVRPLHQQESEHVNCSGHIKIQACYTVSFLKAALEWQQKRMEARSEQ